MTELSFSEGAAETYDQLERDTANFDLLDRVDDLAAAIAEDPAAPEFRRHRFRSPPCWRVPFAGRGHERWCLLWMLEDDMVVVLYLGPDFA